MPEKQYELPGLTLTPTGRNKKAFTKSPLEHNEQVCLCNWLSLIQSRYNLRFYAIPNGGKRNIITAMKLKREGVKPGVPDIAILRDGKCLYIEMKRQTSGTKSPEQKEWHEWMNQNNFPVFTCRGFQDAKMIVEKWIAV